MAWTTPKTWSSEPLTSIDLNTYMRDNQNHLKDRLDASASRVVGEGAVFTTTANEFVDVDTTKLALTLTTHGGDVLLGFTGTVQFSLSSATIHLNVSVNNVDYVGDDGVIGIMNGGTRDSQRNKPVSFVVLIPGLSAGSHTFRLRWKTSSQNTASMDVVGMHPQFWAKEI